MPLIALSIWTTLVNTIRRRQWHPTPVLLPGKSHGWRSLVGCSPWDLGSRRVEHDWATSLSLFTLMHRRRKWQPIPMSLHGESQGWEPGGLPSMGSHRVGHDWSDLAAAAAAAAHIMKRISFLGVLKDLVGLHRTIQLQLLQHYWLVHRLGLLWYWMVCLGNEQRSFCGFWDCIQGLHFGLFCWPGWLLHFF